MRKVLWMGLGGILLLGASGLVMKNRGHLPSAHAGHHHPHSRVMAALLQTQQEQPGLLPALQSRVKAIPVQLDETGEPPLISPMATSPIQPASFQPMLEGPPLLPGSVTAPVREGKEVNPIKAAPDVGSLIDGLFGAFLPDSGEKSGKAAAATTKGKNKITIGVGMGTQMRPFFNVDLDLAKQKNGKNEDASAREIKINPVQNSDNKSLGLTPANTPARSGNRIYTVRFEEENFQYIALKTLGDATRWQDIAKLNPALKMDGVLSRGTALQLPADALLDGEDPAKVQPLPGARPKTPPEAAKVVLPLTGTYPCLLDGKRLLTLPPVVLQQLGQPEQLLLSPGPDVCLWLTGAAHLEKLSDRLEQSSAAEKEVRVFRRLFFGQIEKLQVVQGKLVIPERLALFAQLDKEIALVGVEDHFEVWDLAKWREYTQKQAQAEKK